MGSSRATVVEHGIEAAFYCSNGERYFPFMECICGWGTGRVSSWAEAGELLDDHLRGFEDMKR